MYLVVVYSIGSPHICAFVCFSIIGLTIDGRVYTDSVLKASYWSNIVIRQYVIDGKAFPQNLPHRGGEYEISCQFFRCVLPCHTFTSGFKFSHVDFFNIHRAKVDYCQQHGLTS